MYGKELTRWIRLSGVRTLSPLLSTLPPTWGREVCAGAGWAGHWLVARDRRLARGNLSLVHPDWSEERVRREARRVFLELGRNVFDFLRYPDLPDEGRRGLVHVEGLEHLVATHRAGAGALLVTGHLGCWELLGATLVAEGIPLRAMARPLREPRLDHALTGHRLRMGVQTVSSRGRSREALRHVREGGVLGVLLDQRVKRGGVTVRFLGQPTRMTDGPARMAQACRVPLVPAGIVRTAEHRHRLVILPPIAPEGSVRGITQAAATAVESLIRTAPEQWMWIHPRWESRAGTGDGAACAG